jgi:transcriptional regulator with XRE-family HTH domain
VVPAAKRWLLWVRPEDEDALQVTLGASIRLHRLARGWSQEKLAEHLDVSIAYVGLLERGERMPAVPVLVALARVFGTSLDALVGSAEDEGWLGEATQMLRSVPAPTRRVVIAMLRGVVTHAGEPVSVTKRARRSG